MTSTLIEQFRSSTLPRGIIVAMMTPTDGQGQLMPGVVRDHLKVLKSHRVDGIMAMGTTGEFPHLSLETRIQFLDLVAEHSEGLPILSNISHVNPAFAIELAKRSRIAQAIGVAVMPPYFYPITQEDLGEFLVRVTEPSGLPVWLYNFPERCGTRLELETIAWVADRVPMVGIKQSGGEFSYHADLVALGVEKGVAVFTGSDPRLAEAMWLGVRRCIGGMGNAVGDVKADLFEGFLRGDAAAVELRTAQLKAIAALIDCFPFPLNIVAMMEARRLPTGVPKSMHAPATWVLYQKLVADLRQLYLDFGLV